VIIIIINNISYHRDYHKQRQQQQQHVYFAAFICICHYTKKARALQLPVIYTATELSCIERVLSRTVLTYNRNWHLRRRSVGKELNLSWQLSFKTRQPICW